MFQCVYNVCVDYRQVQFWISHTNLTRHKCFVKNQQSINMVNVVSHTVPSMCKRWKMNSKYHWHKSVFLNSILEEPNCFYLTAVTPEWYNLKQVSTYKSLHGIHTKMCGSDRDGPICCARHSDLAFVFTIIFWDDLISLAFATFIALTNEKLVTWCISPVNHAGLYQS